MTSRIAPLRALFERRRREMEMRDTVDAFVSLFEIGGAPGGPLAGLSFAAKDLFDVAGHVTGAGNPTWAATHGPAEAHAPVVSACLEAGAKLVGKTHTDELAYSLMGINAHHGTPTNPAAPGRAPGGSSSGSAAATAAGLADFALGTDTGGSVRTPASFCGLYGIRTTHGRIPCQGMVPLAPSFDVVGWFARTARTLRAVSEALDLGAQTEIRQPRLLLAEDVWEIAEPATTTRLRPVVRHLQQLYGPLRPVRLADESLAQWRETFRIVQAGEVWQCHGDWVAANAPDFGPGIADRFRMASEIGAEEFATARRHAGAVRAHLAGLLSDDGFAVLPTCPAPAPFVHADEATMNDYRAKVLQMLCPAGLGGLPQVNVPAGLVEGAPVGLSLLGPAGSDRALMEIAARLEEYAAVPNAMA
jgi:amidase